MRPSYRAPMVSHENRAETISWAARASAAARSGSARRRRTAAASAAASPGGTSSPDTSCRMTSGIPPTADATIGVRDTAASRSVRPKGSERDGSTNRRAPFMSRTISGREHRPRNSTRPARPSPPANASSSPRSGPSPARRSLSDRSAAAILANARISVSRPFFSLCIATQSRYRSPSTGAGAAPANSSARTPLWMQTSLPPRRGNRERTSSRKLRDGATIASELPSRPRRDGLYRARGRPSGKRSAPWTDVTSASRPARIRRQSAA
jgi:hypothetical protein